MIRNLISSIIVLTSVFLLLLKYLIHVINHAVSVKMLQRYINSPIIMYNHKTQEYIKSSQSQKSTRCSAIRNLLSFYDVFAKGFIPWNCIIYLMNYLFILCLNSIFQQWKVIFLLILILDFKLKETLSKFSLIRCLCRDRVRGWQKRLGLTRAGILVCLCMRERGGLFFNKLAYCVTKAYTICKYEPIHTLQWIFLYLVTSRCSFVRKF